MHFLWTGATSGDRLCDVQIFEVKGELNLSGELNPHPGSAMYFLADLDYETGKRRTKAKRKAVKEEFKERFEGEEK